MSSELQQIIAMAALLLMASADSAVAYSCSYEMRQSEILSAEAEEVEVSAASSKVRARSFIECATLCTAWKPCSWFDFHQLHHECCMADKPIDCWDSEAPTSRSSFIELTDTCYSAEPCPKQVAVGNLRYCVFMQRVSDSVLFNRTWTEYESGFGDLQNWWMGLRFIHALTSSGSEKLRVEMTSWENATYFCEHPNFAVQSSVDNYTMTVSPFLSNRCSANSDSMMLHSDMQFSTIDADNDDLEEVNCSEEKGGGGWWFKSCTKPNPTGIYFDVNVSGRKNMFWKVQSDDIPMKEIKLMVSITL